MRVIIEMEGAISDVRRAYHRAHVAAATEIGWSSLDEGTFWRLLRKGGREANLLPGAKPIKQEQYLERFSAACERDDILELFTFGPEEMAALRAISERGSVVVITLGARVEVLRQLMENAGLADPIERAEGLSEDPRRRPAELRVLAGNDPRTIVVAAGDAVARAAGAAELFAVGVSGGPCIASRLHQAGADLVCGSLGEFAEALAGGAPELVRRGLLPPSYD